MFRDSLSYFRSEEGRRIVLGLVVVTAVLGVVMVGIDIARYDIIAGSLTALVLMLVMIPLTRWVAAKEDDEQVGRVLLYGLAAKFASTLIRYYFITVVYDDNADAGVYASAGAIFMEHYRHLDFIVSLPYLASRGAETMRIAVFVGIIYTVTGVSRYAASFVFSAMCFLGLVLMYRAYKRAVPEADHRRYLLLIMFLPSLLFWPSSIGKESLMLFAVGVVSYGAALLLTPPIEIKGLAIFGSGVAVLFAIRPHMALIAAIALGVAIASSVVAGFVNSDDKRSDIKGFTIRIVALSLLLVVAALATTQLSVLIGDSGSEGIGTVLERTTVQTSTGGSQYSPVQVAGVQDLPTAIVTVLFRPFPHEARSLTGMIAASEGLILMALFFAGRRRLLAWAKALLRRPYLVYCLVFVLAFVAAFSYISNFGILARQRTQMMPLALTMLGMHPLARTRASFFSVRRRESGDRDDSVELPHPNRGLIPRSLSASVQVSPPQSVHARSLPQGDNT